MNGRSREEIFRIAVAALERRIAGSGLRIDGSFRPLESGALDSLAFVEVLTSIDDELGQSLLLEELDLERLETVDALVDQLHSLQSRRD
jgi:acyl carrier protein